MGYFLSWAKTAAREVEAATWQKKTIGIRRRERIRSSQNMNENQYIV